MKKGFSWCLLFLVCVLAGCLTGYGIVRLTGRSGEKLKNDTKDNAFTIAPTIPIEAPSAAYPPAETIVPSEILTPSEALTPLETLTPSETSAPSKDKDNKEGLSDEPVSGQAVIERVTPTPVLNPTPIPSVSGKKEDSSEMQTTLVPTIMPTAEPTALPEPSVPAVLPEQVTGSPIPEISKVEPTVAVLTEAPAQSETSEEAVTYPMEIFGQTPVVNSSDTYVTYFEFAVDLIEAAREEAGKKGLSETSMFAKFMLKALFCGMDVKNININEPISREEAALAVWIAAQVLGEEGTDTKANRAAGCASDLGGCSSSEKKAIVYLYEQGFAAGQSFYPEYPLQTADSAIWMEKIRQLWK